MQNRGFSLVEVVVAASILVAAMIPLWGLLGSSHRQVTVSTDEIKVSEIATSIIEQIENSDVFPDNGTVTFSPKSDATIVLSKINNLNLSFPEYAKYLNLSGAINITNFPTSSSDGGKLLKLRMKYSPKAKIGKKVKTFEIASYLSRR